MSILAEFEAAASDLVLGPTLEAVPSLAVEIERQYALDPDRPVAFCWVTCADVDRLERALGHDPTVAGFELLERRGRRRLYRIQRSDSNVIGAYRRWMAVGGELLRCRGSDARWEFEMRFPDRDSFTSYHEFLERRGVALDLCRLSDGGRSRGADDVLTEAQREALVLAYEEGFFDVPRETTLSEIAELLDISDQAVSERLRRGQTRLIDEFVR
ncbi:helix-turn-helix domain-containing protein [Natrialbaceae archaeon GCM10025810]|uniref:helix-turn-helix domain-containing protein n=1 Tax=Halovalidus salilacus TaxID=3075124 RepID=UPI00360BEB7E